MNDIRLIAAVGKSGQLGLKGQLPWSKDKGDLFFFKEQTLGHVVIMGDKTFEDLGGYAKLPDRTIYRIQTRWNTDEGGPLDPQFIIGKFANRRIFIAGGAIMYKLWAPYVTRLMISIIDYDGDADCWFPWEYYDKG